MKKLLNTLYVTSENSYLGLDGENVVVYEEKEEIGRLPLHNLEGIVSLSKPCLDGRMCGKECFPMFSLSSREISGEGDRKGKRKCDPQTETV